MRVEEEVRGQISRTSSVTVVFRTAFTVRKEVIEGDEEGYNVLDGRGKKAVFGIVETIACEERRQVYASWHVMV